MKALLSRQYLLTIGLIILLTYVIQQMLPLNPDVAYLLVDTELLLKGGTYVKDFFETNPPMILLFYIPLYWVWQWTGWGIIFLTTTYLISLALCSFAICYYLINKLSYFNNAFKYIISVTLLIAWLILPFGSFGQREHFFIILSMPYFFSIVLRLEDIKLNTFLLVLIGLMAGMVFSFKPFFLVPLIFLEIYLMFKKHSIWTWVRVDMFAMMAVIIAYLVYVQFYHPSYFETILPLVNQFYFASHQRPYYILLVPKFSLFCLMMLACYILWNKKIKDQNWVHVLLIAMLGLMLAFIIPRTGWGYHIIPAYVMGVLLCATLVYQFWLVSEDGVYTKKDFCSLLSIIFAIPFIFVMQDLIQLWRSGTSSGVVLNKKLEALSIHSIYCFTAYMGTAACFPRSTELNLKFAGRFPFFWWFGKLRQMEESKDLTFQRHKDYFVNIIAEDLNRYQPDVVLMAGWDEGEMLSKGNTFPKYFSDNANFRAAWSRYHEIDKVSTMRIYRRI